MSNMQGSKRSPKTECNVEHISMSLSQLTRGSHEPGSGGMRRRYKASDFKAGPLYLDSFGIGIELRYLITTLNLFFVTSISTLVYSEYFTD